MKWFWRLPVAAWRLVASLGWFLLCLPVIAVSLFLPGGSYVENPRSRWLVQQFSWVFCRLLGLRQLPQGRIPDQPGLVVANHLSWVDILLLLAWLPVQFVSKAEVRRWPVIGLLAQRAGTLFLVRGDGASAEQTRRHMTDSLAQGRWVAVFPEGRTHNDGRVHRFHGRLLQSALDAARPVWPVALRFERGGQVCTEPAFRPEESTLVNYLRLLLQPSTRVILGFSPAISPEGMDRRNLAALAQAQVARFAEDPAQLPGPPPVEPAFAPPAGLRGPFWQTVLASTGPRSWRLRRNNPMLAASQPLELELENSHLLAEYSPGGNGRLVVLIHGWEGSARSTYLLSAATRLWQAGYGVARLNLRDHGPTHHINEGLFHSCMLDEATAAVAEIVRRVQPEATLLAGFSLGGNFALRIGMKARWHKLQLAGICAICPPIDPLHAMQGIQYSGWLFSRYFLRKWRRSLRLKQRAFPDLYPADSVPGPGNLEALTRRLIPAYSPYPDMYTYFRGYALDGDRLTGLETPCWILAARDDPVIPFADLLRVQTHENTAIFSTAHGGHCGFIANYRLQSWADHFLLAAAQRWL